MLKYEKRKDLVTKRLEERIEVARNIIFDRKKSKNYNKSFEIELKSKDFDELQGNYPCYPNTESFLAGIRKELKL